MEEASTKTPADGTTLFAGEAWFAPIEAGVRGRVRGFVQGLLEQALAPALGRARVGCSACSVRWRSARYGRG